MTTTTLPNGLAQESAGATPGNEPAPAVRLLLTVSEAAARLGIGRTLMYELIRTGAIESLHVGRLHRVPADALVEFVARERSRAARAS